MKGQSNSVIAGSPRNAFRCSVACFLPEVEHWIADGPDQVTDVSQTPNTVEYYVADRRRVLRSVAKRETAQTIS